jgi:hypothetical protein
MSARSKLIGRPARDGIAAEDGFTIVFAMILLLVGIAVGAAALADTLSTRSHANLDQRQRRALQAADYGIQEVLYRVNQLNLDSMDLNSGKTMALPVCVVHKSNGEWATQNPESTGACPKIEEEIGNHDSYQAEFIPNEKVPTGGSGISFIEPKIVSLGIDDNGNTADANRKVYARVDAGLSSIEPFRTLEANHDLIFKVPAVAEVFNGSARAAHNVEFKGEVAFPPSTFLGTNISLSGGLFSKPSIEYGCEKVFVKGLIGNNVNVVPESMLEHITEKPNPCTEPWFKRAPIRVSGSKPNCPGGCAGLPGYFEKGDFIKITGKETLTLKPGNDYVFCSLATNGPITLEAGASNESLPVRIFLDNPTSSRCSGFTSYETELNFKEPKVKIEPGSFYAGQGIGSLVGGIAKTLSPSQIQVYLAGSETADGTKFVSTSSAPTAFFLYAPSSEVHMSSSTFAGTLMGYDTTIYSTFYTQDLGLNSYPLSNSYGVFHVAGYTQCSPPVTAEQVKKGGLTSSAVEDVVGC